MKKVLLDVFASNYGTIMRLVAGAIAAALTWLITHFGLEMSADTVSILCGLVMAFVQGSLGEFVLKDARQNNQQVQALLQPLVPEVALDKHMGPVTIAAVAQVVEAAKSEGAMPVLAPLPVAS